MMNSMKMAATAFMAGGLFFAPYQGGGAALAQSGSFDENQVKAIETIIKGYLINHPEIMLEVQEAYEKKAEAKRGEATRAKMPEFYSSLSALAKELAPLSIGTGDVTVVEFFDYNCGYCRQTLPELMKLIDADKKIKVQFLELPILAPGSTDAAKIAIAAGKQGKYLEFHKAMFAAGRASKESALKVAEQLGLNMDKIAADSAAPETAELLTKINEMSKSIFVDGTPSFIIGDKINPGAVDIDQLKQLVEEARKDGCKACAEAASPAGVKNEKKS